MSKLINLTGLSKAIKNIKDWVLKQRTHYLKRAEENILYQYMLDKDNVYFRDNSGSYWYLPKGTKLPSEGAENRYELYSVKDNSKMSVLIEMSHDGSHEAYFSGAYGMTLIDVTQLPSVYIPDTVLKTTVQELSESDKNQALANLGIDPVVWKYICNPFMIKKDSIEEFYVPKELVDLDSLFDSTYYNKKIYTWKYIIPAMYVAYNETDDVYFTVKYGIDEESGLHTLNFDNTNIFIDEEFKVVY